MLKVTKSDAEKLLSKKLPNRKVEWSVLYSGVWYICAIDKSDVEEGQFNPYFKVDSNTGKLTEFYISDNIETFARVVEKAENELRR